VKQRERERMEMNTMRRDSSTHFIQEKNGIESGKEGRKVRDIRGGKV